MGDLILLDTLVEPLPMAQSPLHEQLRRTYKLSEKDCARVLPLFAPLQVKKNGHLFRAGA